MLFLSFHETRFDNISFATMQDKFRMADVWNQFNLSCWSKVENLNGLIDDGAVDQMSQSYVLCVIV